MTDWIPTQLYSRPVLWGLYIVAALILAWAVIDTVHRFREGPFVGAGQGTPVSAGKQDRLAPVYRINDIVSAHLFGRVAQNRPVQKVQAPETKLKLALRGVIASEDPVYARAIIAVESARDKSYAVGQIIEKTDARVKAIEPRLVLLDRNGRSESLPLARAGLQRQPESGAGTMAKPPTPRAITKEKSFQSPLWHRPGER